MTSRVRAALTSGALPVALLVALLVGITLIALLPPGRLPYPPGDDFSDATLAHWPSAFFLRQSVWRYGQWPLWRPTEMLGAPFAANPLSKVWYPPQWLALVPGLSITLTLDLLIYGHLVLGALGMLAWARAEGLSDWAGTFAGLAYGLTPKVMAHLGAGHLDLVYAMAWAAWLWWALRRYARAPSSTGGVVLGVVAAMMALADMRLAAYALGAGIIYALSLRWSLRTAGLAALIFGLLMAVYVAPLIALGPMLTRAAISPDEAGAFSLPPRYLLGLLIPDQDGFHEWMTYLGLPALALAVMALRTRKRDVWFLWGIVILAMIYALGTHTPLYRGLVRTVPLLTWLRIPARAWFVVALGITSLSACGAQSLLDAGLGRVGRLAAAGMAGTGLALAAGALVMRQPSLTGTGLALLGTGAALLLAGWPRVGSRGALVALGAVLVVSLVALDATLVEGRREADVFDDDLSQVAASEQRVYSPSFSVLPHEAERAGILTLQGVNPFQLKWSADAIDEAAGVTGVGYSITVPRLPEGGEPESALREAKPDAASLAALGVEQVVASFPIEAAGLSPLDERTVGDQTLTSYAVAGTRPLAYLVRRETDSRASLTALVPARGEASIEALTPNKVTVNVQAAGDSLLVVTQAWAPGWRARVDGHRAEVRRVGGSVQGVAVPAGTHKVELTYRPIADFIGLLISSLTALALILWTLVRRYRSR